MNKKERLELERFAAQIRVETIKSVARRGFGHIGGSLSVADLLAVLYGREMKVRPEEPDWEGRDLLVMSKGHAGPAVYATLALKGFFPMDWLETLNQPGTRLPSHVDRKLTPGVDMTCGSLGQGTSAACGMALGTRLDGSGRRVYLCTGDGELDEGQCWEAALFAGHYKLDNLVWFVDHNGKQLDGYTEKVLDLGDIRAKFEAFGFRALEVDGHDVEAIAGALELARATREKPTCVVLNTVKGKGLPAIEAVELNHHVTLPATDADQALELQEQELVRIGKELQDG